MGFRFPRSERIVVYSGLDGRFFSGGGCDKNEGSILKSVILIFRILTPKLFTNYLFYFIEVCLVFQQSYIVVLSRMIIDQVLLTGDPAEK